MRSITRRAIPALTLIIVSALCIPAVMAAPDGLTAVSLTRDGDPSTWPTTDYRWWDAASNPYSASYRAGYAYDQADVTLTWSDSPGPAFRGRLDAENLKPNFAYQVKLVGKPTAVWGDEGDDATNERIGYAGRWWRAAPSPGNSSDADYEAHKDDPAYVFEGYLLFDWFVTDRFGAAGVELDLDSSFHVLALDSQGSPGVCDGPFIWTTVTGSAGDPAYDSDVGPTDVGVYAQQESGRPCAGEMVLPDGAYDCRLVLTEESFHQSGDGSGTWAGAMRYDSLAFTIAQEPQVDAHAFVDIGNPASEDGLAMTGWGPVEPDANGGGWGGIAGEDPPGRCRTVWSPLEADPVENWASVVLDFGVSDTAPKCLRFRYLDGGSDDSFTLAVDGDVLLTVAAPPTSETWKWADADVTGYVGPHAVTFTATAPAGTYFDPYGQLAIDRIHIGTQINPLVANASPLEVLPSRCGETRRVDFRFSRDCNTAPLRGYSARVICPPGDDALHFDDQDITVNIQPPGLAPDQVFWRIHRAPGAAPDDDWTIDYAILGDTAGAVGGIPDDCDLFGIDFRTGPGEGAGDILLRDVKMGYVDGGLPPAVGSNDARIDVDCTGPPAVTGITASPGHDKVLVSWNPVTEPGAVQEVWRGLWSLDPPDTTVSAYPEYDDHVSPPDVEPVWPAVYADLSDGHWNLLRVMPALEDSIVDFPNPPDGLRRGVYHYVVFGVDPIGNPGPPPDAPARSTSYLLGDLSGPGGLPAADGTIAVNPEINRLALCYGTVDGGEWYDPECDVGPTDDGSGGGVPLTDDLIDFEDLMIFAMNFGASAAKSAGAANPAAVLAWARTGPDCWSLNLLEPCADLRGLRLTEPAAGGGIVIEARALLSGQGGPWFMQDIPRNGLDVGLARLDAPLAGYGELFRARVSDGTDLSGAEIIARDSANSRVEVIVTGATGAAGPPPACRLAANHPNPFNPSTVIEYAVPDARRVRLQVFAVDGGLVATLVDGEMPAGEHRATWDGRDARGEAVASGTYFYRIRAGDFTATRKMTLLK